MGVHTLPGAGEEWNMQLPSISATACRDSTHPGAGRKNPTDLVAELDKIGFWKGFCGGEHGEGVHGPATHLSSGSGPEKPQSQVPHWSIHHHHSWRTSPGAVWIQGSLTSLVPPSLTRSFIICQAAFKKHPVGSTQQSLLMLSGP